MGTTMRSLRELGPLALVAVVVGVVTWRSLDGGGTLGPWLLAGLVLGHGLVHLMFLAPAPPRPVGVTSSGPAWPFDLRRSWLVERVGVDLVTRAGRVLVALVVSCSLVAALAIAGIGIPSAWWAPSLVAAGGASLVLLGLGLSASLLVGIAIDLALLWLVLWSSWTPVA